MAQFFYYKMLIFVKKMRDIQNQDDLFLLVRFFYDKLLADNQINFVFTEIVKLNIESHLPILVTFWSQAILNTGGYSRNLTQIHLDIDQKVALTPQMFGIWLFHFDESVNTHFEGKNATEIKLQAKNLATILMIKIKKQQELSPKNS